MSKFKAVSCNDWSGPDCYLYYSQYLVLLGIRFSHFLQNMSNLNYSSCMDLPVQGCSLCGTVWYRAFRVNLECWKQTAPKHGISKKYPKKSSKNLFKSQRGHWKRMKLWLVFQNFLYTIVSVLTLSSLTLFKLGSHPSLEVFSLLHCSQFDSPDPVSWLNNFLKSNNMSWHHSLMNLAEHVWVLRHLIIWKGRKSISIQRPTTISHLTNRSFISVTTSVCQCKLLN